MKKHLKKHIWLSVMIVLIVIFDQFTKYFAVKYLANNSAKSFIPNFIQLNYYENTGMAFSLFSGARWIFVVLTIIVCVGALFYLYSNKCKQLPVYWSLGLIVAGGIGNVIDRAFNGFVVDFIEPKFIDFAIFNIADSSVTIGAVVLVIYLVVDLFKNGKDNVKND